MEKEFNLKELPDIALNIIGNISQPVKDSSTVIALSGDLGAGKTTLTQEIAKELGVKENIISPTFVIMKGYILPSKDITWKNLIHIDAYRLEKSSEILNLGWEDLVKDKNNLIIIEWPERVSEYIPKDAFKIKLSHIDEGTRTISF